MRLTMPIPTEEELRKHEARFGPEGVDEVRALLHGDRVEICACRHVHTLMLVQTKTQKVAPKTHRKRSAKSRRLR